MPSIPKEVPCFNVNDVQIPAVGFGTFQGDDGNDGVKEAVLQALKIGYRHIDTATAYGNERQVGEAIKESGVPRKDIFVTTKLAQTWHGPADVEEAMDQSLRLLGLEYVDLYLMHFPHAYAAGPDHSTLRQPNGKPLIDYELSRNYTKTWQAMESLVGKGKAKLIGLSNFNILKTKRILEVATIRPAVNQVEAHPYLPQIELLEFCQKEGIHVTAHQPLGGRPVAVVNPNADQPGPMDAAEVAAIAAAYDITVAQVLLSWAVQRGVSVIPKTVNESRMKENREIFALDDESMEKLTGMAATKGSMRFLDPKNHIGFDIFSEDRDEPVQT